MMDKIKIILNLIKKYRYFIVITVILLSFNTYAWFMYVTRVDVSLTAKVRSWNVMFQVHDNNIAQEVTFDTADLYPGMVTYEDGASIVNSGDTTGEAYFVIKSLSVFGSTYSSSNYTQAQLIDRMENSYPFRIHIYLTNNRVYPGDTELFKIEISWPYESNNDALDTQWGMQAYTYRNSYPGQPCISITAEVRVDQTQLQS